MNWFDNLFSENKRIFLDYASATPVLKEVQDTMRPYWSAKFYNPSAIYEEGIKLKNEIENYRASIAKILGAGSKEIIFTGSSTESINLAILGTFEKACEIISKPHLIISAIEHPAVVATAEEVVRRGGQLSVVEVDEEGVVSFESLKKLIKKNTFLVSVGLANSEIGTIQPVSKIGRLIKEERKKRGDDFPLLHTDASAAPSYLFTNLETLQADMLTIDGSKIYGPKGIGVLALRRGVGIHPIIFGGSQEKGRRAGTTNTALIAGLSKALEIAVADREREGLRLESLRQEFIGRVVKSIPEAIINGSKDHHLPSIVSISIPGILAEFLVLKLDREGILASVGTACSLDEKVSGSPVIASLGKKELAESTLRVSLGRHTTKKDLNRAIESFCRVVKIMIK